MFWEEKKEHHAGSHGKGEKGPICTKKGRKVEVKIRAKNLE